MRRSPVLASLSIAALVVSQAGFIEAAEPEAQSDLPTELPRCPDDTFFDEAKPIRPPLSLENVEITTDGLHADATKDATLTGHVELRQGDRTLSADHVHVNAISNAADVNGSVEYHDPDLVVHGSSGTLVDGQATFEGAQFELPRQPARGAAHSMVLNQEGILTLTGVNYTTCPVGRTDWQILAKSVSLDTNSRIGTARSARVEFKGVPILRLPYISFPIGDVRKSGLLFPSIGSSSRGGVQLAVPYYFNLAPNYDLTFTPTLYTQRGIDAATELRFLSSSSRATVTANLLPNDDKTHATRSSLKLEDVTNLPGDWRIKLDAQNVSDAQYFEDFSQGSEGASIAFIPRQLQLSYRDATWNVGALLRNFQTIDQELPNVDRPYTEFPRLYADGRWTPDLPVPLEYGFSAEATAFRREEGVAGWRFDTEPGMQLRFAGAGYFFTPAVALHATQYSLNDQPPGLDKTPQRTLPIVSLDGGLLFERGLGERGQRRITLEPRVMYLYVPYRNQSQLPIFDTGSPDLNWVQLFRTNRYVGSDRIGDANQASVGLTSRLFSSSSGMRYLSATIGQTFYFEQPRVRLPDEPPADSHASDLIAQVELQAFKNWSVDLGTQWDRRNDRPEKSEVRLQYRTDGQHVMNLGYRYQRDRLEQVDFSAAWPVAHDWKVYGRMLYSLRDDQSIEKFAGFEYGSCCWGIRAVVRDYVSRRSGQRDRGIYLQLELKGLSNVGLAADSFLEHAIRGYSAKASQP
jgi:LPS-assembly protein